VQLAEKLLKNEMKRKQQKQPPLSPLPPLQEKNEYFFQSDSCEEKIRTDQILRVSIRPVF